MTLDELLAREAIRDTLAKYNMSGDSLRAEDFAACFTEDGVIESPRAGGGVNFRHEGRAAILAWQLRWKAGEAAADVVRRASFVRHNLTTVKITLTGPDTASVRSYFLVVADNGPDHSGIYMDEFRRVGEDWLIARRRVRTEWNADHSLFVA
jgi:SnoaL-like domain